MDADGPGYSQPDDSVPEPAVTYVACGASHSLALLSAPLQDLARLEVLQRMQGLLPLSKVFDRSSEKVQEQRCPTRIL